LNRLPASVAAFSHAGLWQALRLPSIVTLIVCIGPPSDRA